MPVIDDLIERLRDPRYIGQDAMRAEAADMIEYLVGGLENIIDHDPTKPGLTYGSVESLIASAVGTAKITLETPDAVAARRQKQAR